jgi:hypothetical protein
MKNAEAVLSVKFNSTYSSGQLMKIIQEDIEIFRKLPGLLQKYYISEESTGALSGIYVFETKSARESFWTSELANKIPARYGVIPSTLRVERYEMSLVLNDELLA